MFSQVNSQQIQQSNFQPIHIFLLAEKNVNYHQSVNKLRKSPTRSLFQIEPLNVTLQHREK